MRAIVLSAGLGTRLRPITDRLPKALVPFLNVPLVERRLRALVRAGISEAAVNLHHEGRQIVEHLEEAGGGLPAVRFFWEPRILGTAGALANAREFFEGEDALVWNVDAELSPDLAGLARAHRESGAEITILVARNPAPARFTPLAVSGGRLREIGGAVEEPYLFTGVSIVSAEAIGRIPAGFRSLVEEVWRPALAQGRQIAAVLHRGAFSDLGTPEDLRRASVAALVPDRLFPVEEGLFEAEREVLGPAPLPRAVSIRRSVVGRARVEGEGVVEECVVFDGADVGAAARLERCVVGPVRLPPGAAHRDALLWPDEAGRPAAIPLQRDHERSPAA